MIVDAAYEGQDCEIVLVLRDGTLTAAAAASTAGCPASRPTATRAPTSTRSRAVWAPTRRLGHADHDGATRRLARRAR